MVEGIFVETPGVVILDVTLGFKVVTVTFFVIEDIGVFDGFAVGFEVVTFPEDAGVVDGFPLVLEDSPVWLKGTYRVLCACEVIIRLSRSVK